MANEQSKMYRLSCHGHSDKSDGLQSIANLVQVAGKFGVDAFGISDHDTSIHIRPLYQEIQQWNLKPSHKILPIASFEIGTKLGEIVIVKPGDFDRNFLTAVSSFSGRPGFHDALQTINYFIDSFNCIILLIHPGIPIPTAMSLKNLEKLIQQLDNKVKPNICLEVANWSTNLFFPYNKLLQSRVEKIAQKYELARFGDADFHDAWMLQTQYTLVETDELTPENLVRAVQERKIHPGPSTPLTPANYMHLLLTTAKVCINYALKKA